MKCNLNVRTLQRIETGVVTPRIYTIKAIFEALEYDIYESSEDILDSNNRIAEIFKTLFKHILNIFNLRKHTVYKVLVLIILILSILLFFPQLHTQNKDKLKAKARKQIEYYNNNLTQWYSDIQFDSIKAIYLDNSNLIFDNAFPPSIPNELPTITHPKGVISYYEFFKIALQIQVIEKKSKKMVVENDIAVDLGILIFKSDSDEYKRGTYFCQWRNVNGKWRIETEMFNLK